MATRALPAPPAPPVSVRLYDLGHVHLGTLIVEAPASDGTRVDLLYVQAVDDAGVPLLDDPDTGSHISLASRLTLGPEPRTWEAFLPMGHRHLAVVTHGTSDLDLKPRLRETVHPLVPAGSFDTGEAGLNDIWNLCLVTQRACLTDAYTDTPWREQAQWWGDARVQSQNHFHLVPDDRVLVRGLRQIGHQRLPNGLTYGHAPTVAHSCVLPDFTLTWIITLWDHFWQTGDPRMLLEQEDGVAPCPRLLPLHRRGPRRQRPAASRPALLALPRLVRPPQGGHADAPEPLARARAAVARGGVRSRRTRRAGRRASAPNANSRRSVSTSCCSTSRPASTATASPPTAQPVDRFSVQNQVLALLLGMGNPDAQKQRIADYLRGELHGGADPSSYWITYLYDAAERVGLEREMLDHVVRHWTPMLPHGGCWESFETPAKIRQESVSHAWAAHPLFHFMRTIGGVRQAAPGWSKVLFRPVLDRPGCDRADVKFPTPLGVVHSVWERAGGEADVRLTLPAGVTARVDLPGIEAHAGPGEHRWTVQLPA